MKIGIIAAMEEEKRLLVEKMSVKMTKTIAQWEFVEGELERHEIVLVQSGIGKVMSAITATILIERYQVDAVINTGSAGGLGVDLQIGDVVIANELAYSDVDVTAFGYEYGQLPKMPARYSIDQTWVEPVIQSATAIGLSAHSGLIVSADAFIHTKEARDRIVAHFPDVQATEMEGAAIAQVCHQFQIPCIVIRAISDIPERGDSAVSFEEFVVEAGRKSAEMVCMYLQHV